MRLSPSEGLILTIRGFYTDIFRLQNKTKIVAESSHSEQQLGFMRQFAYLCLTQKPFGRYKGSILPASDA